MITMMPAASSTAFSLSFVWVFILEAPWKHKAFYAVKPQSKFFRFSSVNIG